jgi:hypothetical protein
MRALVRLYCSFSSWFAYREVRARNRNRRSYLSFGKALNLFLDLFLLQGFQIEKQKLKEGR